MAIFLGHPDITVGYYIWKSMIPAALGNIIGGALMVAVVYWYLYLVGDTNPITIDGDNFDLHVSPMASREGGSSPSSSGHMGDPVQTKRVEEIV